MSGNEAIAQGAIDAGCNFYAGYPITPQNELIAYMAKHLPEAGGVFIQSESEISAINMLYGASAAGAQAMTSSSSPGVSLKQEGISYIAGSQLPAVIVNIMRGGPGLGNIAAGQSDYFQATRGGGHGDYRSIVLAPSSVQEAYDMMAKAFALARKYRNPVIVLGDGLLGQMMEPVLLGHQVTRLPGHQVEKTWTLTGCAGRKPNVIKSFFLREGELEQFNAVLQKKYKGIRQKEQRCDGLFLDDARLIIVAYGTMARIVRGVVVELRKKKRKVGLLRPVTLWPFPEKAFQKLSRRKFLTVEMSAGQMLEDVKLAVAGRADVDFLGRMGGGVPTQAEIIRKIRNML